MKSYDFRPFTRGSASYALMTRAGLTLAFTGLLALSITPTGRVSAASEAAIVGQGAGKPLVRLNTPEPLAVKYSGDARAISALRGGSVHPTALATADFNADGAQDVVAGYSTERGGVLTVLLGNPDAFAPKDTSLFAKAMHGDVAATFLQKARAYALPESPDLIVTGDFNRDGNRDVLVAGRGGNLYLLAGDGKGNLDAPRLVNVAGRIWAMAATGDGHVAVSVVTERGPEVRILAPGSAGLTVSATYPLTVRGDVVLWADLGGGMDLAVGGGSRIEILYNALKANPQTETVDLAFDVEGLTAGNFIWNREGRTELAVLAGDGSVQILQHGTLDTRPLTPADIPTRRAVLKETRAQQRMNPPSMGAWTVANKLSYSGSAPSGPVGPSAFYSPRLAASATNDLMVLDGERSRMSILDTSGKTASRSADVSFSGVPVAALTLNQKINARRDTVVLVAGQTSPLLMPEDGPSGDPLVTVNTTADVDPQNACGSTSTLTVSGLSGTISLRAAVCAINNSGAGTYTIDLPAGTYSLSANLYGGGSSADSSGELQVGLQNGENITISGAGENNTIIQQTDGVDRVIEADQVGAGGIPLAIQNLTMTGGKCSTGLDCGYSGGALVAGFYPGDSLTLTNVTVSNSSEEADTPALGGGNQGGGVSMSGPDLTITNSTFSGNSVTASSTNSGYGGGVEFLDDEPGNLTIMGSTFTSNTVAASSPVAAEGGGLWISLNTNGDTATISGSTFTGNQAQGGNGEGGGIFSAGPTTVSNSRITGNTGAGGGSGFWEQGSVTSAADGTGTVKNNWWGCNGGPGASGCDAVAASGVSGDNASVVYNPWLELTISATPNQVNINGSSNLTAGITSNSNSVGGFSVPNGTALTFGGTLGTVNPTNTTLTSGAATSTFDAGGTPGAGSAAATVDNQTVTVTIDIVEAPSITSGSSATFTVGSAGSFTVTTTGSPDPSISETGALPSGVTFIDNGNGTATLSGVPGAGTNGSYPILITAANGVTPAANQNFTLTVNLPQFVLTTAANPAAGGTVTPATGGAYVQGTSVPIMATANTGYYFVNWTSSPDAVGSATSASTTISMNAAESVTANFGANLVVTTANDDNPANAGNCTPQVTPGSNTVDSACSLRDALAFAATTASANITFASAGGQLFSTAQTITLGSAGTLNVPANTSIIGSTSGSGATLTNLVTVSGGGAVGVFFTSSNGVAFSNLAITGGSTQYGGGIENDGGTLTVTNCTFTNNTASSYGGGILSLGTATVTGSTFAGNTAQFGGGLLNYSGSTTITNSTFSDNSASTDGGGFFNNDVMTVTNTTVTGNGGGGGIYWGGATNIMANSIVTGNAGGDSLGNAFTNNGGNQVSTAVNLAPLGSYGGPTQTMPPLAESPAICTGTLANATAAGITGDQRGFPFDPSCPAGFVDAGAVQTGAVIFSANGISFGSTTVGTWSASQYVSMVNKGTTPLSISSISVNGGGANQFAIVNNCGSTLAVGASCLIHGHFQPTVAGPATASITITDSDSTSPQTIPVSGTGVAPTQAITLQLTSLNFGSINVGALSGPQWVTMTNSGTAIVNISSIAVTGTNASEFVFVNNCGTSLAVGGSCSIHGHFAPTATGTASAAVTITDDAAGSPQSIALSGTGVAPTATLSGNSLSFGSVVVNTVAESQAVTVTNNGSAVLTISGIAVTGTNASEFVFANNCGTSLAVGASCTIHGHFAPTALGSATAAVTITDNASDSPQSIALSGTGAAGTSPLTFSASSLPPGSTPTSLNFGNVDTGAVSATQTVIMTNTGTVTVGSISIGLTGANASSFAFGSNCGTTLAVGASCIINTHFAPTATGPMSAAITINDDASTSPQSIALSGTGVTPQLTLSATNLWFGTATVGTSSYSQSVTLTNVGTGALAIASIAVTGNNASSFVFANNCGTSLAAGASCVVHGHFAPTTTGLLNAAITITSGDPASPQTITLGGTGQ